MDRADRRVLAMWALLVALTLLSYESAWGLAWLRNPPIAILAVIAVAMAKVRIVVLDFMEVREAPWRLRAPLEMWTVAIGTGILAFWYSAGA